MRKNRGFRLRSKLVKIFKWTSRPRRRLDRIRQLDFAGRSSNPFSKFLALARRSLEGGVRALSSPRTGYIRVGREPGLVESEPVKAPKGHLAVYVGESEDETQRHLVPVIYFNHPMFGKLLKEAEKVYGFDNPGRIKIPCEVSEFEKVKKSIAAAEPCRRRRRRSSHCCQHC